MVGKKGEEGGPHLLAYVHDKKKQCLRHPKRNEPGPTPCCSQGEGGRRGGLICSTAGRKIRRKITFFKRKKEGFPAARTEKRGGRGSLVVLRQKKDPGKPVFALKEEKLMFVCFPTRGKKRKKKGRHGRRRGCGRRSDSGKKKKGRKRRKRGSGAVREGRGKKKKEVAEKGPCGTGVEKRKEV